MSTSGKCPIAFALWIFDLTSLGFLSSLHSAPQTAWAQRLLSLNRVVRQDEIRIFYALEGPHQLGSSARTDRDGNGVPDRIDDLAVQLRVARLVYTDALGLVPPLSRSRYRNVKSIDVYVWGTPTEEPAGRAFEEPQAIGQAIDDPTDRSLVITVRSDLKPTDLTPARMLFQLYQFGYTYYRNEWFLGGTAGWVQGALAAGDAPVRLLPRNPAECALVWRTGAGAAQFFAGVARAAKAPGTLDLSPTLLRLRYHDGTQVLADSRFAGAPLVRELLEAADRADDETAMRLRFPGGVWPRSKQADAQNNADIWEAVWRVARSRGVILPRDCG